MPSASRQHHQVVVACYLGWTLDAFDFFIMVFVFGDVARDFGISVTSVTFAVTLTLAMRALGAFLFGRLADRIGRRPALMASILGFSACGLVTGFAPDAAWFFIARALFGLAMGGEWGIGASLTMETVPPTWRGPVSGILQAGYPSGYLLACLLYFAYPWLHWRGMFVVGAIPALLVLYIRSSVPESPDWLARRRADPRADLWHIVRHNLKLTIYAAILMAGFNFLSHGTQDMFPRYLQAQLHFGHSTVSSIAIVYNIGAILGGILAGSLSQYIGRRQAIGLAVVLSMLCLPLWILSATPFWIGVGAFLMQLCVQGAWGVVPVHLNELSPPEIRGTFPGVTYQLGNFLAALNLPLQSSVAMALGGDYRWPLAGVAGTAALLILILVIFGPEARNIRMGAATTPAAEAG